MNMQQDDNNLIDQFLSGDQEGFTMLVKKYQNRVFNTVFSLIGRTSSVDDIAQDVFIKVHNNLRFFNRRSAFSTWLYRITVNTTYNYLKKEKRYVTVDDLAGISDKTKSLDGLKQIEDKERQDFVRRAIERLPFKYRSVVVLKDIESLSYSDIAQVLRCRIGTVESRLFRARNKLRVLLNSMLREDL